MSAQTTYNYDTPWGAPGGIYDLAPYIINTYLNGEDNGDMKFGVGVFLGTDGKAHLPKAANDDGVGFLGVTVNNRTKEHAMYDGGVVILKDSALGVMNFGRIYVRVEEGVGITIAEGDSVKLICGGTNTGLFTCSDTSESDVASIDAKFVTAPNNGVAVIQFGA